MNEINLQLNKVATAKDWIVISWSSDIGFGQYTIYRNDDGSWSASSELMDSNKDKAFLSKLMELFIEEINVRG